MGIGPGAWVGLMLGNVPDFVILTLAVSKVEGVVVPLDPTTGNRELEMILEAAPAARAGDAPARRRGRAGGRRPALLRGAAGGAPARRAAVQVRARDPPAAAGDAAVVQPVQAGAAGQPRRRGARRARGRAVHRVGGRRSEGRGQDRRQPGRGRAGDRQDAGRDPRGSRAVHDAAAHQLRLRLRPAGRARERHHAVPRGRGVAEADRQAAARAEHRLLRRQPGALRLAGARPDDQAAQDQRRALPELGVDAAREHRRELPRALRRPPAVLLPRHAGGAAGDRSRGQGARDRRHARSRASRCASRAPRAIG